MHLDVINSALTATVGSSEWGTVKSMTRLSIIKQSFKDLAKSKLEKKVLGRKSGDYLASINSDVT